jgi:hypothetical protein
MHGDCSDGLGGQGVRVGLAALGINRSSFRRFFNFQRYYSLKKTKERSNKNLS